MRLSTKILKGIKIWLSSVIGPSWHTKHWLYSQSHRKGKWGPPCPSLQPAITQFLEEPFHTARVSPAFPHCLFRKLLLRKGPRKGTVTGVPLGALVLPDIYSFQPIPSILACLAMVLLVFALGTHSQAELYGTVLPAPLPPPPYTHLLSFIHLGAGSCCIAQTVRRLLSNLSQPPKYWNCIHNRLPYSLRLTDSPWMDVSGLFSPSLVLCPGDTCARQVCVVQRRGCLVERN